MTDKEDLEQLIKHTKRLIAMSVGYQKTRLRTKLKWYEEQLEKIKD